MRRVLAALLLAAAPAAAQTQGPAAALQIIPAPGSPPAGTPPAAAPPPPQASWLPRGGFVLQALDKVSARGLAVDGRVGQTVHYGSLSITVRACLVRPPDQPADAAAFLDIIDSRPDMPRFSGWMLASEPAVSMLEHPVYDIVLSGCRP